MSVAAVISTLTLSDASRYAWDALVLGAGPAGVTAAATLVQAGHRVLLVDKAAFPRQKVCGGCLNQAALAALRAAGLMPALHGAGARSVHAMRLAVPGRAVQLHLPEGLAISRYAMDAALLRHLIDMGVQVRVSTRARLVSPGVVMLEETKSKRHGCEVRAKVVIQCDGLQGTVDTGNPSTVARDAWMGVGLTLAQSPSYYQPPGTIHMACTTHGYLGMVRAEDQTLHCAAAIAPQALRRWPDPGRALQAILNEVDLPDPGLMDLAQHPWRGIGGLTRHRSRIWQEKLLLVGDACGYVEPFTGEGMAWAAAGGLAAGQLARQAIVHGWSDAIGLQWQHHFDQQLAQRHRRCALIAGLLRRPRLFRLLVNMLHVAPALARPVTRRINRPLAQGEIAWT